MKNRKRLTIILIVISALLVLGNPTERMFLHALSDDFGTIHYGAEMSPAQLKQIGTSSYHSYLLFSRYTYTFGTISVQYYGVGFMTFYLGSSTDELAPHGEDEPIQS